MGSHKGSVASFPHVFFSEFNLQADDKRREAEDAMKRLSIISSMVASAREKTDRAEAILGSTASKSKAASSAAREAKEITMGIQQVRTGSAAIVGRKGFVKKNHGRRGDGWQHHGGPDALTFGPDALTFVYSGSCRYQSWL